MPDTEEVIETPEPTEDPVESSEEGEENPKDDSENPEDDEDSEDSSDEEDDDTEEVDEELKSVFRLFKNPSTRRQALLLLAQQEGLKLTTEEKSEKANKGTPKTLAELLREEMGDEYDLLPTSFTKALDKVFAVRESSIRSEIEADRMERLQIESDRAVVRLFKNFEDAKKLEPKIVSMMKLYPPPRGQEMYDYMKSMYRLAKMDSDERSEKTSLAAKKAERIKNARRESSMKTRNAGTGLVNSGKEPANLKEAVAAAAKELSQKNRR